jgi:hypothetical protein
MSVLRSQSVRQKAEESSEAKDEGRVAIFFGERGPSTPSAPPAPAAPAPRVIAAAPAESEPLQKSKGVGDETDRSSDKRESASEVASAEAPSVRRDAPAVGESAGLAAASAPAPAREEAALKSAREAMAPAGGMALQAARAPLAWDVTVTEAFVRGWALRRVVALPPSAAAPPVSYRVQLDAEGKVVSARALGATTAEMDAAVRSLVFQKLAADAPAEIEIALAAR